MSSKVINLPNGFPFSDVFEEFISDYAKSTTYWYIPKARALHDEGTIPSIKKILQIIFDDFLDEIWNQDTQDELLKRLVAERLLDPYMQGEKQDRTALIRINKKLWEVLGLLWIEENNTIIITDAGFELLTSEIPNLVLQNQIAKWQYPNPSIEQSAGFKGILPHLFLLQILQKLNYRVTRMEYDLFVNLAQSQDDLSKIFRYIKSWRDLNDREQSALLGIAKKIPFRAASKQEQLFDPEELGMGATSSTRFVRILQNSPYQRAFYSYPHYLEIDEKGDIISNSHEELDNLVNNEINNLKVPIFNNKADWFSYYGDPKQQPTWFTYISLAVERASSSAEAEEIVKEGIKKLSPEEEKEIQRKTIEKSIEDFYVDNLGMIEKGLKLLGDRDKKGRQYSTPIGPIDLLCIDENGQYVVIEIKVEEAKDAVFGQILRYIGWVHRNMEDGTDNVRGIILASDFPESARYSRIGLLKDNYNEFIKFSKHHGFKPENI